nr:hypothetical protein CFP56_47353 [Quercus suber]
MPGFLRVKFCYNWFFWRHQVQILPRKNNYKISLALQLGIYCFYLFIYFIGMKFQDIGISQGYKGLHSSNIH